MSLVKCTELRMEGRYLSLTAESGGVGPVIYRLGLDLKSLECMRFDELRAALDEIVNEAIAIKFVCGSAISAVANIEDDWRESDDTPENGDCGGQDA